MRKFMLRGSLPPETQNTTKAEKIEKIIWWVCVRCDTSGL